MHSSELMVFAESNLLPLHSQMKGSVVKQTSSKVMQTHRGPTSSTIFVEPQSQQFCSSPKVGFKGKEETNIFACETYKSQVRQKLSKTVSISLANKKPSASVMIQNYARKQPKTQEDAAQNTKTLQKESMKDRINRYQGGHIFDFQGQTRMSLISFQENFKAMRLKKMGAKTEEIIHLKLKGEPLMASQVVRKDLRNSKEKSNLYITQQSAQLNFQAKSSTTRVRSIISRLHEQEQKQKRKPDEESKTQKTKMRTVSTSQKRHQRKRSANLRQRMHVNIINFVEQKQTQNVNAERKTPFSQLYRRFAKSQNLKIQENCDIEIRKIETPRREDLHVKNKELQVTGRKSKTQDIEHERKHSAKKQDNQNQREVESTVETKLKQRKNLLRNYTFKKTGTTAISKGKEQQASPEDFYVEGWNNSTEFERRQLILLI